MCATILDTAALVINHDPALAEFGPPAPESACRAHLQRILTSATFARAEQLRRLLAWLGERSLSPEALPPAEKEIGEIVLGRKDFDPQTDSVVRKEMRRLREKMQQYYATEGARERVRIVSTGGYRFRFVWSEESGRSLSSGRPCVLLLPVRSLPGVAGQAARLFEEVLVRVAEMGTAQLVAPTTARSYRDRVGDVRDFAAQCGADFVVEGDLALDTELRLTLWFVDGISGRAERPGRFTGSDVDELAALAGAWLDDQLQRRA